MKKIIVITLTLALLFCTGCSNKYISLEDYVTSTPEVKEQFNGIGFENADCVTTVSVKGNILTYSIQYKNKLSEKEIVKIAPEIETAYKEYDSYFDTMVSDLELVTEIDTIQIVVSVCNADGTEIWHTIYK